MEKPTDTAIRPLHETELPAASALAGRVFAEFEAPEYSPEGIGAFLRFAAPETLAAQHRNGSMQSWGAFRQGTLIGIITLTRRSHLCLLFVEKACHRQGIARALFSALRDHCRTAPDTPRITVNSRPTPSKPTAGWDSARPAANAPSTASGSHRWNTYLYKKEPGSARSPVTNIFRKCIPLILQVPSQEPSRSNRPVRAPRKGLLR